ncbi:hypothetical protein N7462_001564 [Penicillium macrosclerotiorum]|uniref:uncharacterized protein n=1 Tax=Penicillium macrosclerotiorum TaxID=303699 RepID=UPI00254713D6|nr:uncharacterized protein N7462_001564 [Penicillium macrosclerotiorum]KAJ5692141.1 hypothetical protein N7462_001564 [Penicillium macrosclerotiorum]
MPVSHLTLTVSHLPTSTSFFLSCLQPLGYQFIGRQDGYIGFGQKQGEPADFWITEQKPGILPSAVHVAFPAPSKDAVTAFFHQAMQAGGKFHGEPKTRDSFGYHSAAVLDFDGNSIEAVYRPGGTVVASEAGSPTIALLENGSVASKSSRASTIKAPSTIAPPRSEAKSRALSKAPTTIERAAPTVVSQQSKASPLAYGPPPAQQSDDGSKAAKTIVGTLIGAAAGAAIAYAMVKGDSQSSSETKEAPAQYIPEWPQLMPAFSQTSHSESQAQPYQQMRAIEAPPTRSVYTTASAPRSSLTRSIASKNPRASTLYEATEFFDDHGRRASDGSIFSVPEDMHLRAIEYPPSSASSARHRGASTLISSYAADKPRALPSPGSTHSASTVKASSTQRRHSHDDRASYTSHHSHHSSYRAMSSHSVRSSSSKPPSKAPSKAASTASSTRTARNIPLPTDSVASATRSYVSARDVPLPGSIADLDVDSHVTPDDSISQVGGSRSGRSSHSRHGGSRHSSRSKFDDPVRPADSVSQVSRASQRTIKAGSGSHAGSKVGSRRGSQVVF